MPTDAGLHLQALSWIQARVCSEFPTSARSTCSDKRLDWVKSESKGANSEKLGVGGFIVTPASCPRCRQEAPHQWVQTRPEKSKPTYLGVERAELRGTENPSQAVRELSCSSWGCLTPAIRNKCCEPTRRQKKVSRRHKT